jgi:hypothetical protein
VKPKLQLIFAVIAVLAISISAAFGQANLTFSGGNGTPLSITLQQSVSYTITSACPSSPIFIFDEAGNPFNFSFPPGISTMTFSINGGTSRPITNANSGFSGDSVTTPNDIYVYGSAPGTAIGNTVVLSAGTYTTTGNVAAAKPADGSFVTFVRGFEGGPIRCSTNGVALGTTAAPVSISGRVTTASGRGIRNVMITMTDSQGNERAARTTAFGYYGFDDVAAGETVTITAKAKQFRFTQSTIVRTTNESVGDADFVSGQ